MSELETLTTGGSETIYGTLAAAKAYIGAMYGDTYTAWRALPVDDDDRKRTLISAKRYLDEQVWIDACNTFALRDALIVNSVPVFQVAEYELAVMILADPTLVAAVDAGSNIKSVTAGSASVEFFSRTSAGDGATKLPTILQRLLGSYLAATQGATSVTSYGATGCATSPFSSCSEYTRKDPY